MTVYMEKYIYSNCNIFSSLNLESISSNDLVHFTVSVRIFDLLWSSSLTPIKQEVG